MEQATAEETAAAIEAEEEEKVGNKQALDQTVVDPLWHALGVAGSHRG